MCESTDDSTLKIGINVCIYSRAYCYGLTQRILELHTNNVMEHNITDCNVDCYVPSAIENGKSR